MSGRGIHDFRRFMRMQAESEARATMAIEAVRSDLTNALAALKAAQDALATRRQAVELGDASVTVGSTLSITTAGAKRFVIPFAGVRVTDALSARPLIYLPDGYGLPQVTCRNAGQLEVRIAVPTIALGTQVQVSMAITALR